MAVPLFYVAGLGWVACLTTLSATVQMNATFAAKSRVTALYQLNFYAWATLGSSLGGSIAKHVGERAAVATSGALCVAVALLATAVPLYRFVNPMGPSTK